MAITKKQKSNLIVIIIAATLTLALFMTGLMILCNKENGNASESSGTNETVTSAIVVIDVENSKNVSESSYFVSETESDIDYKDIISDMTSDDPSHDEADKANSADEPISEIPENEESSDISEEPTVSTPDVYSCGYDKHHCSNEFTHATIVNLELEGCPTCGSHSCPSFYALDEWGYTLYTPSKCPKYDEKNDPVHYCQTCGKPTGDGTNGTCVFYVTDTVCTQCGKPVKAWECHSCE